MFHDAAFGCPGCEQVWLWRRTGVSELVSRSVTGTGSTAEINRVVDMTPDGRYVLYGSTSVDPAGGLVSTSLGRWCATWRARPRPWSRGRSRKVASSMRRSVTTATVAFAADLTVTDSGRPVEIVAAHLLDRSSGELVPLSKTGTADDALSRFSNVAISGDARRVAFTNMSHVVAKVVGG